VRADRLLAILMLLQARGRMTARQLAAEVEVSERTIYRDLDALSTAGIPVYAERGPRGGCGLLDSYRTTLTGLTDHEVRALFMLSMPGPLADLGVGAELKAALLKLSASLPDARRPDEEQMRARIHLDSAPWFQQREPTPHLRTIYEALWSDRMLALTYHLPFETRVERIVSPYGLVAKSSVWHLVFARDGVVRVIQVARVLDAHLLQEHFTRPADFDLSVFWDKWCTAHEQRSQHYRALVRAAPELIPYLPLYFGSRARDLLAQASSPDPDGWLTLTLTFESFEAARGRILGMGRAVEVISPQALRDSIIDFAGQIVTFYGARG
jgi:predicted DNA-binding transcriptional regulator YafY